ncbi:3-oxoacyl-[acyl-carrier-protein] synthase 3 protein 3 [Streptomyces spiroverticillatus]|uniref:3-oxoacyl-[acyl-carrier-protein] synthase 3 protein 3 n=1 Tax=Streptomyces finlayi TaxID=67296 RepID=A0A918X548_9ACTN|nr:ketoacyl-ACP synthase III family protein [Streptomyces finlayi]GHA31752.1 3-oxoacyl-[acyl-carrier-protein] synthase 3 protein 3 [Streptomyces spiroverticillatus]GHD10912.1 3-oxoacyl-[acyl-carrier-protein] synthase 3 protein 3 [Streptomyces finlayi]
MRFDNIWIAGTGGTLGTFEPVADAVADGSYSAEAAESTGMISYSRSDSAPPEMAVTAGRQAVKEAQERGARIDSDTVLLHSHGHFQGIDLWPAACYIAGQLLGPELDSMPVTVNAWSNGSLAALDVAAATLTARPGVPSALITLADRFAPPTNRWYTSPGMVFGDGAAAGVVTRDAGRLRLRSLVSRTDTVLEGLSRGAEPFRTAPEGQPDMRRRTREFLASGEVSLKGVHTRTADCTRAVVGRALDEAGITADEVDWFLTPFVGRTLHRESFLRPLGITPRNSVLELGLTIGHLGPCDQMYGLDHLLRNDLLKSGDRILVLGTGMGFTFSAAVLTADGV